MHMAQRNQGWEQNMTLAYTAATGDGIGRVSYYTFPLLDAVDKVHSLLSAFGFFVFFSSCTRHRLAGSIDSYSFYRDCSSFDAVGEEVWM